MARDTDAIVFAAVIAHDMGAPLLKVPVPLAAPAGRNGNGPWPGWWPASACPSSSWAARSATAGRQSVLDEVRDVMEGGGGGMAMGRTVYQDDDPAEMAGLIAALIHP